MKKSLSAIFFAVLMGASVFLPIKTLAVEVAEESTHTEVVSEEMMQAEEAVATEEHIAETEAHETAEAGHQDPNHLAHLLFVIAIILIGAKIFHIIERAKQPQVVGELIAGIVLGNLTLVGISYFAGYTTEPVISFLAELGVIILLFQIGLESNIGELSKAGVKSLVVALIGAFVPFALGAWVVGPLLLPGQEFITYLFLGASLAATSVGITARVFKDMGFLKTKAATIVIGAAVIDDVLGLMLLAVVSAMATGGEVSVSSVGMILGKSVGFLVGSVLLGQLIAPWVSKAFSKISTGTGTKFTVAISFSLLFSALAKVIGLEPIVGAFAAGLVLDPVHFKVFKEPEVVADVKEVLHEVPDKKKRRVSEILGHFADRSVEDTIEQLALFFVPIFFVVTGMGVSLQALFSLKILILAVAISIVAFIGKFVSGLFLKGSDRFIVGLAMIPRGEVGLIFAAVGRGLGVVTDEIFSLIVAVVLITTIVGPFMLSQQLKKLK